MTLSGIRTRLVQSECRLVLAKAGIQQSEFLMLNLYSSFSYFFNPVESNGSNPCCGMQGDFVLSLFEDGVLPAAFMVGLLITSPIFAEASKYNNAFRLISLGLSIWTVAVAGCGLAWNFWSLVVCRMFVGVGEASFVALASPFIGEFAS